MLKPRLEIVKKHFTELSECYQRLNEIHRAGSFRNALEKLEATFERSDIPSDISTLKGLKGIGPSTIQEITEVLNKGTSERLEGLRLSLADNPTEQVEDLKATLKGLLG